MFFYLDYPWSFFFSSPIAVNLLEERLQPTVTFTLMVAFARIALLESMYSLALSLGHYSFFGLGRLPISNDVAYVYFADGY